MQNEISQLKLYCFHNNFHYYYDSYVQYTSFYEISISVNNYYPTVDSNYDALIYLIEKILIKPTNESNELIVFAAY